MELLLSASAQCGYRRGRSSAICTGRRMMRTWFAMARSMACLIHHVAYVLNRNPRSYSNFSTARINPMFPSSMMSEKGSPLLMYRLPMDTTSRRFASIMCSRASASPFRTRFARACSSAKDKSGVFLISVKYNLVASGFDDDRSSRLLSGPETAGFYRTFGNPPFIGIPRVLPVQGVGEPVLLFSVCRCGGIAHTSPLIAHVFCGLEPAESRCVHRAVFFSRLKGDG